MNDIQRRLFAEAAAIVDKFPGRKIVTDSRKIECGDIFVAVSGVNVEGKNFIPDAVSRGAAAVVYSGTLSEKLPGIEYIEVSDSRMIVSYLFKAYYNSPDETVKLYAVTGTNGKTTSAFLLNFILQQCGVKCGLFSTVEYFTGKEYLPATHTTPDAGQFFRLLDLMKANGLTACAMESSSHALAQNRLDSAEISGAIFTNLTGDHLDFHLNMENYFAAKLRLFTELLKNGGTAAINIDDPYGRKLIELAGKNCSAVSFGTACDADYQICDTEILPGKMSFKLRCKDEEMNIVSTLTGAYNIHNLAGVLTLLHAEGIPADVLEKCAALPFQVPGRLEKVPTVSQAQFYVDFAHTDDALRNVLSTVKEFTAGKLWVVVGAGGDRDRTKRPRMGAAAAEYADVIVVTSDNPRSEEPQAIIHDILSGIPQRTSVHVEVDRAAALHYAVEHACAGDTVVVAGKGHENYQEIAGVKYPFSDREILAGMAK